MFKKYQTNNVFPFIPIFPPFVLEYKFLLPDKPRTLHGHKHEKRTVELYTKNPQQTTDFKYQKRWIS